MLAEIFKESQKQGENKNQENSPQYSWKKNIGDEKESSKGPRFNWKWRLSWMFLFKSLAT
jgi:hypothetical protein